MTILFALLGRFWPQLLGAAALILAWTYFDEVWCNGPCARARADGAEYKAQLAAAQKRATDLALLAAKRLDDIDAATKRQKETDALAFSRLAERAHSLPAVASVRLTDGAVRLWGDAARAANDPGPAAVGAQPAAPVPAAAETGKDGGGAGDAWYSEQDIGVWTIEAAAAYLDAKRHWAACVDAYDAVRTAQPPPEGQP